MYNVAGEEKGAEVEEDEDEDDEEHLLPPPIMQLDERGRKRFYGRATCLL